MHEISSTVEKTNAPKRDVIFKLLYSSFLLEEGRSSRGNDLVFNAKFKSILVAYLWCVTNWFILETSLQNMDSIYFRGKQHF